MTNGRSRCAHGRSKYFVASMLLMAVQAGAQTVDWTNAAGGTWGDATNWSSGAVPGATDAVTIGAAGTYTVDATSSAATAGTLSVSDADATLRIVGNPTGGNTSLTVGTLSNGGTIRLTSVSNSYGSALNLTGTGSVNSGTIDFDAGAAGVDALSGSLSNTGTMAVTSALAQFNGAISNSGTVSIADGAAVSVGSGDTFTNQAGGLVTGTGSASMTVAGGTFVLAGGTVGVPVNLIASGGIAPTLSMPASDGHNAVFNLLTNATATTSVPANTTLNVTTSYSGGNEMLTLADGTQSQGTINLTTNTSITYDSGLTSTGTFTNAGTINTLAPGAYHSIQIAQFQNTGTLNVQNNLSLAGNTSSSGAINIADGAVLTVLSGKTFTSQAGGTMTGSGSMTVAGGTFVLAGGTVGVPVNLIASGGIAPTLSMPASDGHNAVFNLLTNATAATSVPVNTTLNVTTSYSGGNEMLTLADGTQNQGTINLTTNTTINYDSGLTSTGTFTNAGTINTLAPGAYHSIQIAQFQNTGTLNVQNNLSLAGNTSSSGALNIADGAALTVLSGASLSTTGTVNSSGTGQVSVTSGGNFTMAGGTIGVPVNFTAGGSGMGTLTLTAADGHGAQFNFYKNSLVASSIPANARVSGISNYSAGVVDVRLRDGDSNGGVIDLTDDDAGTAYWGSMTVGTNDGTGQYTGSAGTYTNNGVIYLDHGAASAERRIYAGQFNNVGTIHASTDMQLYSSMDNSGLIDLSALSAGQAMTVMSGHVLRNLTGGEIDGGQVMVDSSTFELAGGTVAAPVHLLNTTSTLPTLIVSAADGQNARFSFDRAGTLGGTGLAPNTNVAITTSLAYGNATVTAPAGFANHGSITMGSTAPIGYYYYGTLQGAGTVSNTGQITANYGHGKITGTLDNQGVVAAINQGTLDLGGATVNGYTVTGTDLKGNPVAGTLGQGTWSVAGGGQIDFGPKAPITRNDATILIDGTGSQIVGLLMTLNHNSGTLGLSGGATLDYSTLAPGTGPGGFTNEGRIQIDGAGTALVPTGFTQTGGTTYLSNGGQLGSSNAYADITLTGGTLSGSGSIIGHELTNDGGLVSPGTTAGDGTHTPGLLTVNGAFQQAAAGATAFTINSFSNAQFDRLHVTGQATLDGAMILSAAPGYVPNPGEQFTLVQADGGISGHFSTVAVTPLPTGDHWLVRTASQGANVGSVSAELAVDVTHDLSGGTSTTPITVNLGDTTQYSASEIATLRATAQDQGFQIVNDSSPLGFHVTAPAGTSVVGTVSSNVTTSAGVTVEANSVLKVLPGAQLLNLGAVVDGQVSAIKVTAGQLVATGTGKLIAAGGGNLIAAGGGNLIAAGGGNVIAKGGGRLIAAGGGNLIATGGGNLIAAGGGNVVATGGGNEPGGVMMSPGLAAGASTVLASGPMSSVVAESGGTVQLDGGAIQADGVVDVQAGGVLTGNGTIAAAGGVQVEGSLTPSGGTLTVNAPVALAGGASLGGAGTLAAKQGMAVSGPVSNSGAAALQVTGGLTLAAGASLDLGKGSLELIPATGGPAVDVATVRQELHDGLLTSLTASADAQHRLGLGYLANLADGSVLVKYAYLGDANLDGRINADDYALVDRGFRQGGSMWAAGDFNYDGVVNSQDYLLIDRSYALQTGTLSPEMLAERQVEFGSAYVAELVASVPEPGVGMAAWVMAAGVAGAGRRRRRTGPGGADMRVYG